MKNTVGLIVLADTKDRGLIAVLQVRGNLNTEKDEQETYRGASQLTVHGSINEGESQIDALLREAKEELGEEFARIIDSGSNRGQTFVELNRVENKEISVVNFGNILSANDLEKIKLDPSTGGSIRLISKDGIDSIRELKPSESLNGVTDKNEIAMFPCDIKAVRLAFEKLAI